MAWGITVVMGKQWVWEESWDQQKQTRNHKNWRMAILKGNMLVTSTTVTRATRSILCLPKWFSLYLWLLPPVLQTGNISGSELGQEHAEKHWPAGLSHDFGLQSSKLRLFSGTLRILPGIQQPPAYSHLEQSTGLDFNVCSSLGIKSFLWEAVPRLCLSDHLTQRKSCLDNPAGLKSLKGIAYTFLPFYPLALRVSASVSSSMLILRGELMFNTQCI